MYKLDFPKPGQVAVCSDCGSQPLRSFCRLSEERILCSGCYAGYLRSIGQEISFKKKRRVNYAFDIDAQGEEDSNG